MKAFSKTLKKMLVAGATAAAAAAMVAPVGASTIAVFGDNNTDNYLATLGHTVTLVSDAQLATPGFLSAFDTFVYTRNGASFGSTLSAAAAANVSAFVTGNVVVFASDLADLVGSNANANQLFANAASWAGNKGFIGEFTGACAAMTSNTAGLTALGLLAGSCSGLAGVASGDPVDVLQNAHPVMAGMGDPYTVPGGHDFYSLLAGVSGGDVLAMGSNQRPTVLAHDGAAAVPTPSGIALVLAAGLAAVGLRRRSRQA